MTEQEYVEFLYEVEALEQEDTIDIDKMWARAESLEQDKYQARRNRRS